MTGGEFREQDGDSIFKRAWVCAGEVLDRLENPGYFSVKGLSDIDKDDAVELLYTVLEFAQVHGIIDGYADDKMREACGQDPE
jgi:hypothetical protein